MNRPGRVRPGLVVASRRNLLYFLLSPAQSEELTLEKELPRHADLVDERLVYWHFMAALIFMAASMRAVS